MQEGNVPWNAAPLISLVVSEINNEHRHQPVPPAFLHFQLIDLWEGYQEFSSRVLGMEARGMESGRRLGCLAVLLSRERQRHPRGRSVNRYTASWGNRRKWRKEYSRERGSLRGRKTESRGQGRRLDANDRRKGSLFGLCWRWRVWRIGTLGPVSSYLND